LNKRALAAVAAVVIAAVIFWPEDDETPASREQQSGAGIREAPRSGPGDRGARWNMPRQTAPPGSIYGRGRGYSFRSDHPPQPQIPYGVSPQAAPYAYPQQPQFRFRPMEEPTAEQKRFSGNYGTEAIPYSQTPGYGWTVPGYGTAPGTGRNAPAFQPPAVQPWNTPGYGRAPAQPWNGPSYTPTPSQPWQDPAHVPAPPQPWEGPAYSPATPTDRPWEKPGYGNPPPYSGGPGQTLYSVR
jgi:hypothetical protein